MLRWLVLVLLLANAGYFAWSQHWLGGLGWAPVSESEPERLRQQIEPEALRILPGQGGSSSNNNNSNTVAKADAPAVSVPVFTPAQVPALPASPAAEAPAANGTPQMPAAAVDGSGVTVSAAGAAAVATPLPVAAERGECLQAGPFDSAQADAWRRAASVLPQGSWSLERSATPGRWMVYLGRFADADALAKKRVELRARNISFDRAGVAALEPGLSLGRFSSEEAAERALATLARRNDVRNARVVVERPESISFQLRLPLVDAGLRAQLNALRPALAGNALRSCF